MELALTAMSEETVERYYFLSLVEIFIKGPIRAQLKLHFILTALYLFLLYFKPENSP